MCVSRLSGSCHAVPYWSKYPAGPRSHMSICRLLEGPVGYRLQADGTNPTNKGWPGGFFNTEKAWGPKGVPPVSSPPWSPYPVLKEDTILRTSPWLSPQLQKLLQSLFPFNLSLAHFCILFDRNCSKPPRNISLAVFHMRAACVLKCLLYNKNHVSREILTDRAVFSFFSIIKPHSYNCEKHNESTSYVKSSG